MDKKIIIVLAIVALAVLLSGCAQPGNCGNSVCDSGEDNANCPGDCFQPSDGPPMPGTPSPDGTTPEMPF